MWGFVLLKGNGVGGGVYVVEEDKVYLIYSRRDQFRVGPMRHSSFNQNQYMSFWRTEKNLL